jgi:hypothetical protein
MDRFMSRHATFIILFALACTGIPMTAAADMLGDLTQGLGQSVSNAVKRGVDSALRNQPAGNSPAAPQAETSPSSGQPVQIATPSTSSGNLSSAPQMVAASTATGPLPARGKATPDQIDAAVAMYHDNCAVHTDYLRNMHDCDCLARGAREMLTARMGVVVSTEEQNQLGQTCAAPKETIYAWIYRTCNDFMRHQRTNHAQFCGCTADRFSDSFRANPNSNLRKVEALRRASMKACGL